MAEGSIGSDEYMGKLESFVRRMTDGVKGLNNQSALYGRFSEVAGFYRK